MKNYTTRIGRSVRSLQIFFDVFVDGDEHIVDERAVNVQPACLIHAVHLRVEMHASQLFVRHRRFAGAMLQPFLHGDARQRALPMIRERGQDGLNEDFEILFHVQHFRFDEELYTKDAVRGRIFRAKFPAHRPQ